MYNVFVVFEDSRTGEFFYSSWSTDDLSACLSDVLTHVGVASRLISFCAFPSSHVWGEAVVAGKSKGT